MMLLLCENVNCFCDFVGAILIAEINWPFVARCGTHNLWLLALFIGAGRGAIACFGFSKTSYLLLNGSNYFGTCS